MVRLERNFYLQPTIVVAQALIGKNLHLAHNGQILIGQIIETEAYLATDPASHSFKGLNRRNQAMFLDGGYTYVYFIYGRYFCLNLVTQAAGRPEAVLIRALLPIHNLGDKPIIGPGKVCQALDINLTSNGLDTTTSKVLWVTDTGETPTYRATPRIGISKAQDKLWRFVATHD